MYSITSGRHVTNTFVNPNQLQEWTQPAFDNNYKIVLNKMDGGPIGLEGGDVNGIIDWTNHQYIKRREAHRIVPVPEYVDELFNQSIDGANYWGSLFTHHLADVDTGAHYPVGIFQNDFAAIAASYGRGSLDNILVTTDEEIYNYLNIRDNILVNKTLNGNILTITFDGNVPEYIIGDTYFTTERSFLFIRDLWKINNFITFSLHNQSPVIIQNGSRHPAAMQVPKRPLKIL